MKTRALFVLATIILIASCTKTDLTRPQASMTTSSLENSALSKESNFHLLTSHTWIYKRYYTNSIYPTQLGDLVFVRGGSNNTLDLTLNRATFNKDGTVNEIDQFGNFVPGTWQFTDASQDHMVVSNSYGSFYSTIILLTKTNFRWNDSYNQRSGDMIPACK